MHNFEDQVVAALSWNLSDKTILKNNFNLSMISQSGTFL